MTTLQDLTDPQKPINDPIFVDYIANVGIKNVKIDDLERIFDVHRLKIFYNVPGFDKFYYFKIAEKTNEVMVKWTIAIGVMTVTMLFMTATMLYISFHPSSIPIQIINQ